MIRVHVICEGQTEEMFIEQVISPILNPQQIFLYPSLIGRPGHKGGHFKYERLCDDLEERLLKDTGSYTTTFFDFYGLPNNFPGKNEALGETGALGKSQRLLTIFLEALRDKFPDDALRRFMPYIQMYEFEGLLFSNSEKLASSLYRDDLSPSFQQIENSFISPEEINNSPYTAPSKRIKDIYPEYDKPISGSLAALEIGIKEIREKCSLFNDWISSLESLKELR